MAIGDFIVIPARTRDLRGCVSRSWSGIDFVSASLSDVWPQDVCIDGRGGLFMLTRRRQMISAIVLELHHVDASGVRTGPVTIGSQVTLDLAARLVPSAPGTCMVVWAFQPQNTLPLLAQRFNEQCQAIWQTPVELIPRPGGFQMLATASDGAGGAVVGALRASTQFFVQRVDDAGNLRFGPSGSLISPLQASPFESLDDPPQQAAQLLNVGNGFVLVLQVSHFVGVATRISLVGMWLDTNGQMIGPPFPIRSQLAPADTIETGEQWFQRSSVRRVAGADNGGFWVAAAPAASHPTLVLLRYNSGAVLPAVVVLHRLLAGPQTYAITEDGSGGVFIATVGPSGAVGVDRIDSGGSPTWTSAPAINFATIADLPSETHVAPLASRVVGLASRYPTSVIVAYQDRKRLKFRCFGFDGRAIGGETDVSPRPGDQTALLFAQPTAVSVIVRRGDPPADVGVPCGWMTTASASQIVSGQKLGCCLNDDFEIVRNPWSYRCAIPVDWPPAIAGTISVNFPCSREGVESFGVLSLPHLTRIPEFGLPGGLASKSVSPPAWVRIQFSNLPRDVRVEIFSHKGDRIARSKRLSPEASEQATHELTFKPRAELSYAVAFIRKGTRETSTAITVGVAAAFGQGRPPRPRKRARRLRRQRASPARRSPPRSRK
jgi:hypothetical protein